jgi:threonine dehydrogenase-like Zn-dependent dehydrogenase
MAERLRASPVWFWGMNPLAASLIPVHVLDRAETGPKPELVRALRATYHAGSVLDLDFEPDIIVECTGVGSVIADAIEKIGAGGIICLTGVGAGGIASRAVARRGNSSAEEQCAGWQRECEQAPLVQSG